MIPIILLPIMIVLGLLISDLIFQLTFAPWSKPHIVYKRRHYTARRRTLFGIPIYLNGWGHWGDYSSSKDFQTFASAKKYLDEWLAEDAEEKAIKVEGTRVVTGQIESQKPYELKIIRNSAGEPLGFNGPDGKYYDLTSKEQQ